MLVVFEMTHMENRSSERVYCVRDEFKHRRYDFNTDSTENAGEKENDHLRSKIRRIFVKNITTPVLNRYIQSLALRYFGHNYYVSRT